MKPLMRILAATDLSAPARPAVARAFRLAAPGGSELHILCALELDADLIIVGKHGSHITEELLLSSVTQAQSKSE